MVAVVVRSGSGRAVGFKVLGNICIVCAGKRVGLRKLHKALKPFGDGYIFSEDFDASFKSHFAEFDSRPLRESLLFNAFLKTAASLKWGKVGVVCTDTLTPRKVAALLRFVSELILVGVETDESFLTDCICRYGACPDFGGVSELYSCDAVLSVGGLPNFDGVTFGLGGATVCGDGLYLPEAASPVLSYNVDPIKFLSLLSAETGENLGDLCPGFLSVEGEKVPLSRFLMQRQKDFVVNFLGLV